jgi:hypothetical protein
MYDRIVALCKMESGEPKECTKVRTQTNSSDGNHDLEGRPCASAIANGRTDPVQIHTGHDLAEKDHVAPNRHAKARVKAALRAAV